MKIELTTYIYRTCKFVSPLLQAIYMIDKVTVKARMLQPCTMCDTEFQVHVNYRILSRVHVRYVISNLHRISIGPVKKEFKLYLNQPYNLYEIKMCIMAMCRRAQYKSLSGLAIYSIV